MAGKAHINIPTDKIAEFCRKHHIRKLLLYGSVLRDDFRKDSDVDILVEFDQDKNTGLTFFAMQKEMSDLLGRPVDLNTINCLSPYFVDEVLNQAEPIYVTT